MDAEGQSDGKVKICTLKRSAHDPKHTSVSVKRAGGSVIFPDDAPHGPRFKTNADVYRKVRSASLQRHACELIRRDFSMHAPP